VVTLDFYDGNAAEYAAGGQVNPRLAAFLARCRPGGKILELGSGSGQDARAIIDAGFSLDATDGSAELAAIAGAFIGQPVRVMLFNELSASQEYDGIYASASLLHAPREQLPDVIGRVREALKDGGVVWASFKSGADEGLDMFGRYYNYLGADELIACWRDNAEWASLELESWKGSGHDKLPTDWLAVTATR
jgi:SAM-dependent methyltransferase